jgi:tol-pal system protein YbgF
LQQPHLIAALALTLVGCATLPPEEDPVQIRLNDLDTRLAKIERVVTNQSLLELPQRIDALQAEVRSLRGQAEELDNGSEAARKQQRDLYADLDKRLAALESGGATTAAVAATSGAAPVATAGVATDAPQLAYGRAFDALKAANYPVAIAGFRSFLGTYSRHELADNAQYWLGEAYYVTRDYDNALAAFARVGSEWPASSKAADALLKMGYAQFELKRYREARETLTAVGQRFPGTDAARLAAERIRRIPEGSR